MGANENEEPPLRSVVLKNASNIVQAHRGAEEELVAANETCGQRTGELSEMRKVEDALRLSHAQFSATIDQSPIGIYGVDSSLRIQHVNAKGRPVFGPIAPIIGRDLGEVFSLLWAPHLVTETIRFFQHTLATGDPHIAPGFAEERRDNKAQQYYDWELHRVALPDGQHGVVCYFVDTAVQVLAQRALRENEARLNDDLLDLTRITRGKLELHRERVPVGQMIENAISTCQTELIAKQLTLIRELVQPELRLYADSARIAQILWNLLRNSIKFTPTGGSIWVRLKPPVPGEDPREVTIEVQNTGIGMEPAQMARMFDAFEQGGRKITQQFGGLGLGLAISKAIAEAHQGTIAGTSDGIGRGSLFTVTLPIQPEPNEKPGSTPPQPSVAPTAESGTPGGERRARILLVEDHADTAAVLVRMLRRTGYDVLHAPSIEAALKTADTEMSGAGLDLVISDLSLPDGSGLDLMKSLSTKYRLRGIALSGFGMDSDREQSAAAGFTRHLTKPIDIAILRRTIAELLQPP